MTILSNTLHPSAIRAEMHALGIRTNRAPVVALGFILLAILDVLIALIALAGS